MTRAKLARHAYSLDEVADVLGVSLSTVKRLIYSGHLRSVKTVPGKSGRRMVSVEAVREYLGDRRRRQP